VCLRYTSTKDDDARPLFFVLIYLSSYISIMNTYMPPKSLAYAIRILEFFFFFNQKIPRYTIDPKFMLALNEWGNYQWFYFFLFSSTARCSLWNLSHCWVLIIYTAGDVYYKLFRPPEHTIIHEQINLFLRRSLTLFCLSLPIFNLIGTNSSTLSTLIYYYYLQKKKKNDGQLW
jgi:hypothetical protein